MANGSIKIGPLGLTLKGISAGAAVALAIFGVVVALAIGIALFLIFVSNVFAIVNGQTDYGIIFWTVLVGLALVSVVTSSSTD